MRDSFRGIPGVERQIISNKGIPVGITENRKSVTHPNKITLGVGEMVKMGEIQNPILRKEIELQQRVNDLTKKLEENAHERMRKQYPNVEVRGHEYYARIAQIKESILSENPELREEIEKSEASLKEIKKKRYKFGHETRDDLYVGKEGTLVYSLQMGERMAEELEKAHVFKKNEYGIIVADPEWDVKIAELVRRLKQTKYVADIHQIEILPEYRGKGIAQALLDVALWDIEHTKSDVEFSVARIGGLNPDGEKMIAIFKKAGFLAFSAGQLVWDDPEPYTLVIRENPHFIRGEKN